MAKQNSIDVQARLRRNPSKRESGTTLSYLWGNNDLLPIEYLDIINSLASAKMAMSHFASYVVGHGFSDEATRVLNMDVLKPIGTHGYNSLQDLLSGCALQATLYDGSFALWIRRNSEGDVCAVELFDALHELRKSMDSEGRYVWYPDFRVNFRSGRRYYFDAYAGPSITAQEQADRMAYQERVNGAYYGEIYWHYKPTFGNERYPIPVAFNSSELMQANAAAARAILIKAQVQFLPPVIITTPLLDRKTDDNGSSQHSRFTAGIAAYNGSDVASNLMHFEGSEGNMPTAQVLNIPDLVGQLMEGYNRTSTAIMQMYGVDPALMGYAQPGQLGNVQQLATAEQMLNSKANARRREILDVLKPIVNGYTLANHKGLVVDWTIDDLQQYKVGPDQMWGVMTPDEQRGYYGLDVIQAATKPAAQQQLETINTLSPLVANAALNVLTVNEQRAMFGFPPIEGGDVLQSTTPTTPPADDVPNV